MADRPGDLDHGQPEGSRFGSQGPDQGYAFKLASHFDDKLHLGKLSRDDVIAGCVAIAMKRAALFGRGPVVSDLNAAFSVYGFLHSDPPVELVELREQLFAQIASHHHYQERRAVVDIVSAQTLRQAPDAIVNAARTDWRSNLEIGGQEISGPED